MKYVTGMTLLELMMTLCIVGVGLTLAVPSFQEIISKHRLRSVSEELYDELKFARSEGFKNGTDIYANFAVTGGAWCYGFNNGATCACGTANSCQINGVQYVHNNTTENQSVTMAITGIAGNTVKFDGLRSTADRTGAITFTLDGKSITLNITRTGNVTMCSNSFPEYPTC